MKAIIAILVLAAVASASSLDGFRSWAKEHGKVYTVNEQARRFAIFKENMAVIERLNLDHPSATFGPNQFSDLTHDEFSAVYTNLHLPSHVQSADFEVLPAQVSAELDLRYMLPAVKNQAQCGSCWAFSAIGNAEGVTYKNNGGKVVSLSEQQLVSCDYGNSGCNGGWMATADAYLVKHGSASEDSYPYTSGSGQVAACKTFTATAKFSSYTDFGRISADATIIDHLATLGPLSVAIEADRSYFQTYKSGILDNPTSCGTSLNHGVTLVGYGTESGKDYWLVRNSWGTTWGDKGYVKLVRGHNMCGINSALSSIKA
jgi:C1A family cysteine protease